MMNMISFCWRNGCFRGFLLNAFLGLIHLTYFLQLKIYFSTRTIEHLTSINMDFQNENFSYFCPKNMFSQFLNQVQTQMRPHHICCSKPRSCKVLFAISNQTPNLAYFHSNLINFNLNGDLEYCSFSQPSLSYSYFIS